MKTRINNVKKGIVTLLFAAVIAGLTACETDPVKSQRGELPDKDLLENTYVKIRSIKSPTEFAVVNLSEGTTVTEDRIYCRLTRPAERAMTITAAVDESLVEACNEEYGTDLLPFPAGNVTIAGNGTIAVAAGERISNKIQVSFKSDGLAAGTYLLPIAISSNDAALTDGGKAVYYGVKVRGIDIGNYELDTEYLNVFYLNTTEYQPLLADIWILQKTEAMPPFNTLWERTYGNIVNLRIVQIGYEADTERALLVLNSDIRYVLEHADKYIRPLQDKGRKVCLSLEGNGSGLGFCNLTDSQIADFTAQVKACLELYDLDGVNFFDRNAGYGQVEGMPKMNTTSYPKLIKAMREAMPDKLLTLADYEEPTEYFGDTEATGGIEVGQYLDYAWSGYMSESEDIQLLDPWEVIDLTPGDAADLGMMLPTTNHPRRPIAGVPSENFGYFAVPWYPAASDFLMTAQGFMNVAIWDMMGYAPNNTIVWADLISNQQNAYESSWNAVPSMLWAVFGDEAMDGTYMYNVFVNYGWGALNYGDLAKDW